MHESEMPTRAVEDLRRKVAAMEAGMLGMPQVAMPLTHHFAPGVYARELYIPAGTLIVGRVHKYGHVNFLMRGDITVWTENGMKRLRAPCVLTSPPGVKRVGFAHEDTVWVTAHGVGAEDGDGCDLEALENKLTAPTMDDYDAYLADVEKIRIEEVAP